MAKGGGPKAAEARAQEAMRNAAEVAASWSREQIAAGGACDFCARLLEEGKISMWQTRRDVSATLSVLDTEDLGAASAPIYYGSLWAACPVCDPVVAQRDPQALVDHVMANVDRTRVPVSEDTELWHRDSLLTLYAELYEAGLERIG